MKPTIDYLNARRALMPATGGKTYSREAEQCPDRDLDPCDRLDLECDSKWSDLRINADAMWARIFARFGLDQDQQSETEIPF